MDLEFTKMHGLGNDFVLFNAFAGSITLSPEQIRFVADRRFGVGCDQVLLLESANVPDADVRFRITMRMALRWSSAETVSVVSVAFFGNMAVWTRMRLWWRPSMDC